MKKKHYIIVGDNNFWYSTFDAKNKKELRQEVEEVKDDITKNMYGEEGKCCELYVYEATEVERITLSDIK